MSTMSPRESIPTSGAVPPASALDTGTGSPNAAPAGLIEANTLGPVDVPRTPPPLGSSHTTTTSPAPSMPARAFSGWLPEAAVDTVTGAPKVADPAGRVAARTAHG